MADGNHSRDDLFSKSIRAGKRTYFFDVKATKGNDFYLTITESKRRYSDDGRQHFEKHKLFLYKEDFDKFLEGLHETIERIEALRDSNHYDDYDGYPSENGVSQESTTHENEVKHVPSSDMIDDIDFDDLER
jgi:hypothetical protein